MVDINSSRTVCHSHFFIVHDIAKKCNLFILANFILSDLANMEKAPSKKGG